MAVTDTFAQSVLTLTEDLRQAINDPKDQIRLLVQCASFTVPDLDSSAFTQATVATAALCRRAALASLANATAAYQPTSTNECLAILAACVPLYDAAIIEAADMGDTETYATLRDLRAAVVADLQQRSISLPALLDVQRDASLPSLVIAWQLYADANRDTDLVTRNPSVIHPAFFPNSFEALSS